MRQRSTRQAFTVVEVMMGVALSSMFLGLFATSLVQYYQGVTDAAATALRQDEQGRILDYLARDLRSASAVKVEQEGTVLVLQMPSTFEQAGPNETPLINSLGQLLFGGSTMQVTYATVDGYFERKTAAKTQYLAPMPQGASVSFLPVVLRGRAVPPITATVTVMQGRKRPKPYTARRVYDPQAYATILP